MKFIFALATLVLAFVMLVTAVAGVFVGQVQQMEQQQAQLANAGGFSSVANAALTIQSYLTGSHANEYVKQDPFMQKLEGYWKTYCQAPDGSLCGYATSGHLQCVEFVTAAQWLAGDPITDHPDAVTFWANYAQKAGWQEIESPSAFPNAPLTPPHLGDLIVWKGGGILQQQPNGTTTTVDAFGHIAVVVGWKAPSAVQDGSIEVAEANAPGNKYPAALLNPYTASSQAGNTYTMVVHPNYQIDTWKQYTDSTTHITYAAETVLGFLHHATTLKTSVQIAQNGPYATTLPPGKTLSDPYVQEAWNDAVSAGIPPGYFIRQIQQESGFNPAAVSPVGAVGIAQFMPTTAAGLGVDPTNPHQALQAAARMMATSADTTYHGDYAKALTAYNGGDGEVQAAEAAAAKAGDSWLNHLYSETRNYIHIIMGI